MKASDDKKLDLAKEVLLAYIANSPAEQRDVDSVCAAAKKIFETVDQMVEEIAPSGGHAGFRP